MLHFPSPQPGVSRLALWRVGEWTQVWFGNISILWGRYSGNHYSHFYRWRNRGPNGRVLGNGIRSPDFLPFFFFKVFLMWTIFRVFIEFATILLLFYVLVFGGRHVGILAPWPGIEPAPPALEGGVSTTGPPGKSLSWFSSHGNPWPSCRSRSAVETTHSWHGAHSSSLFLEDLLQTFKMGPPPAEFFY